MIDKDKTPADRVILRQKAEDILKSRSLAIPGDIAALSSEQIQKMVHELHVHQIELEIQNEELRTAQAELEESRSRYFDLYDMAPVGYCAISEKGLILKANLSAAAMLGTSRGNLIDQPISGFLFKEDQDIYYQHRKRLFDSGDAQICELRMKRPDGSLFWARLDASAAEDDGKMYTCRVVWTDITARKEAEALQEELQEQLLESRKLESVGRLAGGVAHDFNNMLGVILGHVELALEDTDENHDLHADLKEIRTAAQRSADLTKQLLTFARKEIISPRQLDVNNTVENMLNMLRRLIGKTSIWYGNRVLICGKLKWTHLRSIRSSPTSA